MPRSSYTPWRRPLTVLGGTVVLLAAMTGQAFASGSSTPSYRADAAPSTVAAGTQAEVKITLTQVGSHTDELGSAKITPPAGFDLTSATSTRGTVTIASGSAIIDTVDLDNTGDTATVTLKASVPCGVSGSGDWTVVAHRNYIFSSGGSAQVRDPASQLTTDVRKCTLAFTTQPKSAAVDTVITGVEADPSGAKVKVQLLDGNGNNESQSGIGVSLTIGSGTGATGANLSGGSDTTNSDGIAMFSPKIDKAGQNYRLEASATTSGISGDVSASFDISDVAVVCSGSCSGSSQQGNTGATVNAASNGGVLSFSIGVDNVDCNNSANKFYEGTSKALTFNVTGGTGRTDITLKLDKASVTKPFLKYDVCFSSPNSSFTNKYGKPIAAGEAGLLPFCLNPLRNRADPCVILKWPDRQGNVLVKFSVPAGDPRGKI
jgi:hypothetical protein